MNYKYFKFDNPAAVIIHTREKYLYTLGGWKYQPDATHSAPVDAQFYTNFITSVPFFNSRVREAYTPFGRLPVELVTISPNGLTKYIDKFDFWTGGAK